MHSHLLEFDNVHGKWRASFSSGSDSITIDETRLSFIGATEISDLPLEGVDVVIDCTGVFKSADQLQSYFDRSVKKSGRFRPCQRR